MTTRVFDFQHHILTYREPATRNSKQTEQRTTRIDLAFVLALLVVPLAGATEPPGGWLGAGIAALAVLWLAAILGRRLRWDWLTLLAAIAGFALPRGNLPSIGPAFFVATVLCGTLWLTNLPRSRRRNSDRPQTGTRERAAQLMVGLSGERHVGQLLARELPEEYVVINGLALPRGSGDIDHLVVGPTGVFLLETKTMAGHIVCEADGTWRRTRVSRAGAQYEAYIGDPVAQVQRNIFAVRQALERRHPELMRTTGLWIQGLVVFAHPRAVLDAGRSRVPAVLLEDAVSRIRASAPRRALMTNDIDVITAALLKEARETRGLVFRNSAQALVEFVLALPLVLALVFGSVAISRFVQADTAVIAVAHEAARAGALSNTPSSAIESMRERAALVAPGVGLDPNLVQLEWDVSNFSRDPGEVLAAVTYPLDFGDLPFVGWAMPKSVRAEHVEWVDPFRSGVSSPAGATD